MKKVRVSCLLALILSFVIGINAIATAAAPFKDISKSHWGYEIIQWAIDNKVTTGYPDGKFRPHQIVSQNEFLAMLIRAFEPSDFPQDSSISWDQAYISYATNLGWTLSPYNPPLTRGGAAQLLANASGKSYSINDSVQYLLDVNLTNGKTTKTLNGFAKQDSLTRIEAIAFIKKFKQNYNKLSLSPSVVQPYNREENVIVFNNEAFKFTLTLPLSWNNKYKVIDSSDAKKPGFYNFDFVFQPSSSSGILFTLSVWPKEYWKISGTNMIENVPVVKKLGEYNGNVYIFHIPTDVQYDPNSETEVQTYNSLFEDVKTIPFTFELVQ